MVVRISDKTQNYSKVTKLLFKPKYLMADAKSQANFGVMYAGLVIVMIPTLVLYICVQKKITQGMSIGGMKE